MGNDLRQNRIAKETTFRMLYSAMFSTIMYILAECLSWESKRAKTRRLIGDIM